MKKINKNITISFLLFFILTVVFSGCIETTSSEKIGIIVTVVPQIEMLEQLGKNYIDITVMVLTGQDPHTFEPTPEQMKKVAQAQAYFIVGSGVEFEILYMDTILEQNPDIKIYDCSKDIDILSYNQHYNQSQQQEQEDEHEVDDEHDHDGTDPHIWTSPLNYKQMTETVYNGLLELDTEHQDYYTENYQIYITRLNELHTNLSTLLQPYHGKSFLVYHPAWGYFADIYNLTQIAINPEGKQPGPAGIAAIIAQAQQENISIIFVSPQFDTTTAETIAVEIQGTVAIANPLMTNYTATVYTLGLKLVQGFKNTYFL